LQQANEAQLQASFDAIQIDSVRADDRRLMVKFDFKPKAK
jgi:hypothetical protein